MKLLFAATLAAASLAGQLLDAQWLHQPTAGIPRTSDGKPDLGAPAPRAVGTSGKAPGGHPDLSGLWTFLPAGGGIAELKDSDIQPWALALRRERSQNYLKDGPSIQCLPVGFIVAGLVKFVQTPGLLVILAEDLEYRQVFLDGRELPKDPNPAFMGYSVGHWEGDTLVVESTGYNERAWLGGGYPHTERMKMTERFTRPDFGHLNLEMTISDPEIYARPFTTRLAATYTADTELLEYVCAENERDRAHLIGKKSDEKYTVIQVPAETLSRYAGAYDFPAQPFGFPGGVLQMDFTVEDGVLKISINAGEKVPLKAISKNVFVGVLNSQIEFVDNGQGEVTHLIIHGVEGDVPGERKPRP
jgi:hypothetical protein